MSPCAKKYALTIGDPWSPLADGACVPVAAGATQKVAGFIRGTGFIGTAGIGYLAIAPCLANDTPSLYVTDEKFDREDMTVISAPNVLYTGVNAVPCGNLPYGALALTGGNAANTRVMGRIVASGARVWYTGRAINMAGVVYSFRDPYHGSVQMIPAGLGGVVPSTQASFGARREARVNNFDRSMVELSDFAVKEDECELATYGQFARFATAPEARTNALYPFCNANASLTIPGGGAGDYTVVAGHATGYPTMGFIINGTPGETFSFELRTHVEYGGQGAAALATRTEVDIQGAQQVLGAANEAQSVGQEAAAVPLFERIVAALETGAGLATRVQRAGATIAATAAGVGAMAVGYRGRQRQRMLREL